MVNGVDVNDNLFAQPQNLFIEDAIEETQVLTSGISAEYGRFTGGVVNAITKSGGNTFSGSYRMNLLNPAWTDETPFEARSPTPAPARPSGHRVSGQAAGHSRRHLRRADRARSSVVLRRRPLPEDRHAARRCRRRASASSRTTSTSAARSSSPAPWRQPHDPGRLPEQLPRAHQQFGPSVFIIDPPARSTAPTRTTTTSPTTAACAATALWRGAVLAAQVQVRRRRRHQHQHHRLAVHRADAAPASTTRRTSTRPTRKTATTGSSPAT